jgi:regulatory protein YycI of two-component signal transduction system YycFG
MNPYRLNGISGYHFRKAVCEGLKIEHIEIYRTIKNISIEGIIITKDDRKYKLELKEIKDEKQS